jgi:hypothetical protein
MLILCDLQIFGCLTYGHASSVSVSWHFFAERGIDLDQQGGPVKQQP